MECLRHRNSVGHRDLAKVSYEFSLGETNVVVVAFVSHVVEESGQQIGRDR